jgi:hypothetical protein
MIAVIGNDNHWMLVIVLHQVCRHSINDCGVTKTWLHRRVRDRGDPVDEFVLALEAKHHRVAKKVIDEPLMACRGSCTEGDDPPASQ